MKSERRTTCRKCGREVEPIVLAFGKEAYPPLCPRCSRANEEREQRLETRRRRLNWANKQKAEVGEVVPPLFRRARLRRIPELLKRKIIGLDEGIGVFLWGPVGTGKSYALCAFARHWIIQGSCVKRVKWDGLCNRIRAGYGAGRSDEDSLSPLIAADKLIIEDLGSSVEVGKRESSFAVRTLLLLLDERLEQCRPAYITSNKPLEEIGDSFDQRIKSRIMGMCEIVRVTGKDKRDREKKR